MLDKLVKRVLFVAIVAIACLDLTGGAVRASVDPPHENVACGGCHSGGFKNAMYDYSPNCLNCHTDGGEASQKPFAINDVPNIFGNFTTTQEQKRWLTHAWGVPGENPDAGVTLSSRDAKLAFNPLGFFGGRRTSSGTGTNPQHIISCPQCHHLHKKKYENFLKWDNTSDSLCRNCHNARNVSSANGGSHPIGVTLKNTTAFYFGTPQNPYTSIAGSGVQLKGPSGDKVYCMTCHGVHKADSNPYTNDTSFSNLSSGDGYLLRTYNDSDLCKMCHNYQDHGNSQVMTCRNCHTPHATNGNVSLIYGNITTPVIDGVSNGRVDVTKNSVGSGFVFLKTQGTKTGICEACHGLNNDSLQGQNQTGRFWDWTAIHSISKADAPTTDCMECHPHVLEGSAGTNSFLAGDAACSGCHGQPPAADTAGPGGYATIPENNYRQYGTSFDEGSTPHVKHAGVGGYPFGDQKIGTSYGIGGKCRACHANDEEDPDNHMRTTPSVENFRTVAFGLYSYSVGVGVGSYGGTGDYRCTNVYCHSDGTGSFANSTTPRWGDSGSKWPNPANCANCHAYPPATNKHTKHVAGGVNYSFTCNNCHNETTDGANEIILNGTSTKHVNRVKDVIWGDVAVSGGVSPNYDPGTQDCSDVYCHGNFPNGTGNNVTMNFSSGTAACGSCHDAVSPPNSAGSHTTHIGPLAGEYGFKCDRCHDQQMDNTNNMDDKTGHVDGVKSILFDDSVTTNSGGTTNDTDHSGVIKRECYNIYCHSMGTTTTPPYSAPREQPQWGVELYCNDCHGNDDYSYLDWRSAMPNYTSTTEGGSLKVNSHKKHVIDNNIECKDCHNDTTKDNTTIFDTSWPSVHVNGTYDIKVVSAYDAGSNSYDGSKCSKIVCHGSGSTPAWGTNGYCTDCHYGADVDDAADYGNFSGVVAKVYSSDWATRGHGRNNDSYGVTENPAAQKFCTACHDENVNHGDSDRPFRTKTGPGDTDGDLDEFCLNCHGSKSTVEASGWVYGVVTGIQTHSYENISTAGYKNLTTWRFTPKCVDCHDPHGDGNIAMIHDKVATGGSDVKGRKYAFDVGSTVTFTRYTGATSAGVFANEEDAYMPTQVCRVCHERTANYSRTAKTTHYVGKKCTNCHKHNTGFKPAGCDGGCHGYPPTTVGTLVDGVDVEDQSTYNPTGSAGPGKHDTHINTLGYGCVYCHDEGMDDDTYENLNITIGFAAFDPYTSGIYDGQDSVSTYEGDVAGTTGGNTGAGYCSNVKCHGSNEAWLTHSKTGGPNPINPEWLSGTIVCGNCHGAKDPDGSSGANSWPTTGAHVKHAAAGERNYDCKLCHNATIGVSSDALSATHVNAESQVELDQNALINGSKYIQGTGAYNDTTVNSGFQACSDTYCHSLGNVTSVGTFTLPPTNPISWDESSACNSCHGNNNGAYTGTWKKAMPEYTDGDPKANKHVKHVGDNSITCQVCHTVTTKDSVTINDQDAHVNRAYNVDFQSDVSGSYGGAVAKSCDGTSCHSHSVPTWGQAQDTIVCQDCHYANAGNEDDFTFNTFTGVVAKIYSSTYMDTGHGRNTGNYASGNQGAGKVCMDCHIDTVGHNDANYFRLDLQYGDNTVDGLCLSCHGSQSQIGERGAPFGRATGIQSHTYDNLNAAGYGNLTTWHFTPKCVDCHDPHGDTNLFMIHDKVSHQGSDDVGRPNIFPNISAVVFTATENDDSYDDGSGTGRLCVVCHDRTDHNGGPYAPTNHNNQTLDCRTCHNHKQGFNPGGCDGCHSYPPPSGPSTWAEDELDDATWGLHEPHAKNPRNRPGIPQNNEEKLPGVSGYDCVECHGPEDNGWPTSGHGDGKDTADLYNLINDLGVNFTANSPGKDSVVDDVCSNVSCHGGRDYPRKWAKPTDCDDCHGYANRFASYNNITTGSHVMHTYSGATMAAGKRYDCTQCHINNFNNFSTHYDSDVDIDFTAGYSNGAAYGRGTNFEPHTTTNEFKDCSAAYCHGATLDPLARGSDTTPEWGKPETAACGTCHRVDNTMDQGAHNKHLVTVGMSCVYCHASNTEKTHVNGVVNFKDNGQDKAGTTVCAGCHYGSTTAKDEWNSATLQTCDSCHFDTADTDDFNFTGITSLNKETARIDSGDWITTGHGRPSGTYPGGSTNSGANLLCAACHDGENIDHGEFGVGGNPFRLISSNGTPDRYCTRCHGEGETGANKKVFTHASSTVSPARWDFRIKCIDCHDPHGDNNAFMIHSSVMTPNAGPSRREASDSDGVPSGQQLSNIDFTYANETSDYANRTGGDAYAGRRICTTCHEQTNDPDPPNDTRFRRFGTADDAHGTSKCTNCHSHSGGFKGVPCDGCHGNPPVDNTTVIGGSANPGDPPEATTGLSSANAGAERHLPHINNLADSDKCKRCHDTGMSTTGGKKNALTIDIEFAGGSMNLYTTGTYDGRSALSNGYAYDGDVTTGDGYTCTNVKCHGGGGWLTSSAGALTDPNWTDSSTGECGDCHGAKKDTGGGYSWPTTYAHEKHVDDTTYDIMCVTCHSDTVSLTNHTTLDKTKHVNEKSEVKLNTNDARIEGTGLSYTDNQVNGGTYWDCDNTYCHSDGTELTTGFPVPNNSLTWDGGPSACDSCHTGGLSGPTYGTSGSKGNSHAEHIAKGYGCENCHNATTTTGSTITGHANHVNQQYDILLAGGDYDTNGAASNYTWGASATSTCKQVKCHGSDSTFIRAGAFGNDTTPTWGDDTYETCSDGNCHLNDVSTPKITQGGHGKHTGGGAGEYSFACTKCHTDPASADHVDQGIDFWDDLETGVGGTAVCGSCHKNGDDVSAKAGWNSSTARTCTSCHANRSNVASLPDSHLKHLDPATYDTRFECAFCHSKTVKVGDEGTIADTAFHASSTIDVYFNGFENNSTTGSMNTTTKVCSETYCHSNGTDVGGNDYTDADDDPNMAPDWDLPSALNCNGCHGTYPAVYSDWRDAMPRYPNGAPKFNSHSTHVLVNDIGCVNCHSTTLSANNTISAGAGGGFLQNHIDGEYDVAFSKAGGSYNDVTRTCTGVNCHGGRAVVWGDNGNVNCQDCHYATSGSEDDWVYTNLTSASMVAARVYTTEWSAYGHGGKAVACDDCHNPSVGHGDSNNFFRLYTSDSNAMCGNCHGNTAALGEWTPALGNITGYVPHTKAATEGNASWNQFQGQGVKCVDCHDPHGDVNRKMIQTFVNHSGSDRFGRPASGPSYATPGDYARTYVNFTTNPVGMINWSSFVKPEFDGICQACHTESTGDANMANFSKNLYTNHNSPDRCTNCHDHKGGFKGGGDCDSCHGFPPTIGDGKSYKGTALEGKGAHVKHVDHLQTLKDITLDPATNTFGDADTIDICGECHDLTVPANHMSGADDRQMLINPAYQFGGTAPAYNGNPATSSDTNPKNCSNVSCHFKTSPKWQDPATAGN